ncbi:MAG TPA: alpha/beta fold hydrolase [Solirubrobacteraceae bacterium]|nr:alpha/beta fold hydrolase [Solirubrobacteraceae bacterium]
MSDSAVPRQPEIFHAGTVTLRSDEVLPAARLAYVVHGTLNAEGDNAILLPTFYGSRHDDNAYLIGPDRALDPGRYCIVVPNLLGNGVSSSPSQTAGPFPLVTIHDNVTLQHRLVTEVLGIREFALVIGFSMGGQQAYEWACRFPAMVRRLAVLCGAARTAPHTWVFLEGVRAALTSAGPLDDPTAAAAGLRAMARVWAGWGLSQAWYRQRRHEAAGYASLEQFLAAEWDSGFDGWDARDLLSLIDTWQAHDVAGPGGDDAAYAAALGRVSAEALIMPCATDLYFPPEDAAVEVAHLARGRLCVIDSVWGHAAGGGADPDDLAVIEREVRALLDR